MGEGTAQRAGADWENKGATESKLRGVGWFARGLAAREEGGQFVFRCDVQKGDACVND